MAKQTLICIAAAAALALGAQASAQTPLLHYDFDEAASGIDAAIDHGSGDPAPGAFIGAVRTGNTPGGFSVGAADLTGATAEDLKYVTGGDADKLDGLSQFTLTAWINLQETPTGNRRIMSKQAGDAAFSGFTWNISDPGDGSARSAAAFSTRMFIGGSNGFEFDPIPTDPNFVMDADNKWTFLAVTYDGTQTSNNVNYYMGDETGSVTLLATTSINAGTTTPSDAAFHIGHTDAAATANTSLPGFVDDVRVYGSLLSLADLDEVRLANLPDDVPLLPGDANRDGRVDGEDFLIWQASFSTQEGATWDDGDFNGDGRVDGEDFLIWQAHFGQVASSSAVTPEPAALSLLVLAGAGLMARRRR